MSTKKHLSPLFEIDILTSRDQKNIIIKKGFFYNPNPKFTGFFQGEANLTAGRVAGYYCNAHTKVAFKNSPANQNLESESSLLNHRIQDCDQLSSPIPPYPTYSTNQNASTPRITRPQLENYIRNFIQSQVSPLTPTISQTCPSENPHHLQQDRETRPTENATNQDKDHFNE